MPAGALIEASNACHRRHAANSFGMRGTGAMPADFQIVPAQVGWMRGCPQPGRIRRPRPDDERHVMGTWRLTARPPGFP
ncbi:MAG: hypothetical protein JJU40_13190 [Rhodobacteraceae bacterium]|nr:hypothetical protein [Paracoccaceae bacterium]